MRAYLTLLPCLLTLTLMGSEVKAELAAVHLEEAFENLLQAVEERNTQLTELARHVMLDRYLAEERIRQEGDSGLVNIFNYKTGPENFHSGSHTGRTFAAMMDIPSSVGLSGFGEINLVLNGVQFKTSHTIYSLVQPANSTEWLATESITPPPVPPSVLDQQTMEGQITEMQEYFRAFKLQNSSIRDYKDYFKPVLCYIEGFWSDPTTSGMERETEEEKWMDLTEMSRLASYIGSRRARDISTLPKTILGIDDKGVPLYALWNYRVVCHPFTMDMVPTSALKLVDDLAYRVPHKVDIEDLFYSRGARFKLEGQDAPGFHTDTSLLDDLVSQIPGLDNVPAYLFENEFTDRQIVVSVDNKTPLNLGYYNRRFYDTDRDTMRENKQLRGFSDANMFVALTSQERVAPLRLTVGGKAMPELRASWMLPLEIVYLSPLLSWNPYNLAFYQGTDASSVRGEGRSGKQGSPLNGTNPDTFVRTPFEFYTKMPFNVKVDDVINEAHVLDTKGEVWRVTSSNTRTITGPIGSDVGMVRLRYPILPLHQEGQAVWKELNAFKAYINHELVDVADDLRGVILPK